MPRAYTSIPPKTAKNLLRVFQTNVSILRLLRLFTAIYVFAPHVSAIPFQMAHFIQLLRRRMTKTSKMLPTVAAVLPAEKLNETLVKWGLLPCCRFSRPLSINLAFLAILPGKSVVRFLPKTGIWALGILSLDFLPGGVPFFCNEFTRRRGI
jgi:hypothetical protein